MRNLFIPLITILLVTLGTGTLSGQEERDRSPELTPATESNQSTKQENETSEIGNYLIDFSDYEEGSIDEWLKKKGFKFEKAAKNRRQFDLDVDEGGLILGAKTRMRGFILNGSLKPRTYSGVRIEWGVIKYPKGASYEEKVNNEAILVLIFFGHDKVSSGHLVIPDSPYFIGLFLGRHDMVYKSYKGKYYRKSGRFVCLGNPQPGETIVSEFDLAYAFKRYFKKDRVPKISGVALEMDTTSSGHGGRAAAFVNKIEFFE